jgi:transcriptional regulator with XRE-family HTH domain
MLDVSTTFMVLKSEIQKSLAIKIGGSVAAIRKENGWTQGGLAERIGVETETVSRFERGATLPSLVTLQRLALALNTTMADLIGEGSSMPNDQARVISAWLADLRSGDREFIVGMLKHWCAHLRGG